MLKELFERSVKNSDIPIILSDNAFSDDVITFIIPKKMGYYKALNFIVKHEKSSEVFKELSVESLTQPSCTYHIEKKSPEVLINLRGSLFYKINTFFLALSWTKEFKGLYDFFIFLHELSHTSDNQKMKLYDGQDTEYHSDFFAVFNVLNEFQTVENKIAFLDGYSKHREQCCNLTYRMEYTQFIVDFFKTYMNHLDFEYFIENYNELDEAIKESVVNHRASGSELAKYGLLKTLKKRS